MMSVKETGIETRALSTIAAEITRDWSQAKGGIYFGAMPYLSAMRALANMSDSYGEDSARCVVTYFLANASSWRGETARRVKAELKAMDKAAERKGVTW